ncbi:hypothetical protein M419DRAFT_118592, partial [Trichoderma reesei RUT C-30]
HTTPSHLPAIRYLESTSNTIVATVNDKLSDRSSALVLLFFPIRPLSNLVYLHC